MNRNNNHTDKLNEFGPKFQTKTLAVLMNDGEFLDQVYDVFEVEFYDNEGLQWIADGLIRYYEEYRKPATFEYFKAELSDMEDPNLKTSVVDKLKHIWHAREDSDLEYVKDKFSTFARNQKMKLAVLESIDLLKRGNYDQIREKVDEALKAGLNKNLGHLYFDDMEIRFEEAARDVIPTGWDVLDNDIDGGLGKGEIGTMVATSGAGKTWFLCCLAANALRQGKRVVYYTMELNERQISHRLDSVFSGYSPTDVKDHKTYIRQILEEIREAGGDLITQQYPMNAVTAHTLAAHYDRVLNVRGDIDLVLVDYGDLLVSARSHDGGSYEEKGNIYAELRRMAVEKEVPIWTVSQSQRSAIRSNIVEADQIAESYKKVMIGDVVLSLSRKRVDKLSNTGRFHMMKNRFGKDGHMYPAMIDTERGKIELYDDDSEEGRRLKVKMAQAESDAERQALAEKYQEHVSKKKTDTHITPSRMVSGASSSNVDFGGKFSS